MQPHQQRVADEKAELDDKLGKLKAFHSSQLFAGLDEAERERLHRQAEVMDEYSRILGARISAF